MPNTEEELANGSSTPAQHVIIMALLFECFCNLGNSIQECIAKAQQSESLAQSQGALRDPMHYWERLYFAVGLDKKAKGLSRTVLIHGIVSQNKNPADGALDPSSKYYSLQGSRLQGQVVSHIASEAEEQLQELRAVCRTGQPAPDCRESGRGWGAAGGPAANNARPHHHPPPPPSGSWIWLWGPILRLTGRPGRSRTASPTTLHIDRPCHVKCAPRVLAGPSWHASLRSISPLRRRVTPRSSRGALMVLAPGPLQVRRA